MFEKQIREFSLQFGFDIARATRIDELQDFLNLLQPVLIDEPLCRIGPNGDGGYVLPAPVEKYKYCFSPGVSTKVTFERELETFGIKSFLADGSIDCPVGLPEQMEFDRIFIGFSAEKNFETLESWVSRKVGHRAKGMLLQMDVEGWEYDVLINTDPSILGRFDTIIIEFHNFSQILNKHSFVFIRSIFYKLLNNFDVVHLHPNNACHAMSANNIVIPVAVEITFARKGTVSVKGKVNALPIPQDKPNNPLIPEIDIQGWWK